MGIALPPGVIAPEGNSNRAEPMKD